MTFPRLTSWLLLLFWGRTCIPLQSVVFKSGGPALPHINLLTCASHIDPFYFCCVLQCYAGFLTGTLTGALAYRAHVQAGTLDSHDRLVRNCQMIQQCDAMRCCDDSECGCCTIFPSIIFNTCLCPFLLTAACVDCCTFSAISSLRQGCIRSSDEVYIELLEERPLLGGEIMR